MPTFYIPLGQAFYSTGPAGTVQSGYFADPATGTPGIPIAIPQADAPNILQHWTLLSIYAPYAIIFDAGTQPVNFQLGISALINGTPVWAQQANGQMFGLATSQVLAGDLFNPLELNAGQKLTFSYQVEFDQAGVSGFGSIFIGGRAPPAIPITVQPVPGVVNYDVAYAPALGRS